MKLFLEENIFKNNPMIKEGILNPYGLKKIFELWKKNSPGNTVYHIWSLIVLNSFFKKYIYN